MNTQEHFLDEEGNVAGGRFVGTGISIKWQNGPGPANGASFEDVMDALIGRLAHCQGSQQKCREYALALTKIEEAKHWIEHRK